MQKRANLARSKSKFAARWFRFFGLTLLGVAAGGMTVGTKTMCKGAAQTQVEASFTRNGPSGTAAKLSPPSDGSG